MRSSSDRLKFIVGYTLIILLSLPSCYEPQDGCLDIEATNFDFTADNPCADCCTYPNLEVRLKHSVGDTSLPFGENFTIDGSQFFRIVSWEFYFSDLQLCRSGEKISVLDTLALPIRENGDLFFETIEDNFAYVSRTDFTLNMGTVRTSGQFDSIRFNIGVNAQANRGQADSLSASHPLGLNTEENNWNETDGYLFQRIRLIRDTLNLEDTLELQIVADPQLISIELPYSLNVASGFTVSIPIDIDYFMWLKGIDFVADTEEVMKTKIVGNTAEAFSILE
ncbi:MAG: MbnP family protein [Bacteroidota bacterium]